MHHGSSISRRSNSRRSILKSQRFLSNWALVALAVVGFAGALSTGCERTISDDERTLTLSIR